MIYEINRSKLEKPTLVQNSTLKDAGWAELDLQKYLFQHLPTLVGPDLMVIGQSSPWQPEVDLLALDSEGDLWFFELKAIQSSAEHLLQVLRYSQSYSALSVDDLSRIYEHHHNDFKRSLAVAFCEYFGYSWPTSVQEWGARLGQRHHLVVVTDGADDETIGAIGHWQRHGLDIRAWTYRIYTQGDRTFRLELPELYHWGKRISSSLPGIFVVNTNRRHDALAEPHMLQNGLALATVDKWMRKINRITSGSRVLLYANVEGIKACGIATPERRDGMLGDSPMRYVRLRDFHILKKVIPKEEAEKICKANLVVRHTVFELRGTTGEKLWEAAVKNT
jgi:hypothetical protein